MAWEAHCHFAIEFWGKIIRMTKNGDAFFRHDGENGEKIDGENGKNGEKAKKRQKWRENRWQKWKIRHFAMAKIEKKINGEWQ